MTDKITSAILLLLGIFGCIVLLILLYLVVSPITFLILVVAFILIVKMK